MREQLLTTQSVTAEDGTPILLSYYLLTEELVDSSGTLICELYGARIDKQRAAQTVSHSIPRVTVLAGEMLRLVGELSRGCAFPETMEDCLQELL